MYRKFVERRLRKPYIPVDKGRNLNVHRTVSGRPGHLLNVLCPLNLRPVSTGIENLKWFSLDVLRETYLGPFQLSMYEKV